MGLLGDEASARRRELVEATDLTPAGAVSVDGDGSGVGDGEAEGVVAVEGVVRVHETTLSPPLSDAEIVDLPDAPADDGAAGPGASGRQALAGDSETAEREDDGPGAGADAATGTAAQETTSDALAAEESDRGPPVLTTHARRRRDAPGESETTVRSVPFVVEDETGRVLVDPGDVDDRSVLLSVGQTERFLGDESATRLAPAASGDATKALARARTALGATPNWVHERASLRAGDEVYVLGRPRDENGTTTVAPDPETGLFVVSDLSPSAVAEQLARVEGGIDAQFWRFVAIGAVVAVALLMTITVAVLFVAT